MPMTQAELDAAKQDARERKEDKEQAKLKAEERKENEAPRKALSDTFNAIKKKLGFKKGGYVKAADGCAQRGKTRGKMV